MPNTNRPARCPHHPPVGPFDGAFDVSPEEARADTVFEIECVKAGGEVAPWLTREEALAQLEAELRNLDQRLSPAPSYPCTCA